MSALIGYIRNSMNSGATTITVPAEIVAEATKEELEEARQLCAINNVKLSVSGK